MLDTLQEARLVAFVLLVSLIAAWLWLVALGSYQQVFRTQALLGFLC